MKMTDIRSEKIAIREERFEVNKIYQQYFALLNRYLNLRLIFMGGGGVVVGVMTGPAGAVAGVCYGSAASGIRSLLLS